MVSPQPFPQLYTLAFEDGPFTLASGEKAGEAPLVAVLTYGALIERIAFSKLEVDGLDATDRMVEVWEGIQAKVDLVILHGLPYAGFNIVDARALYERTGCPILVAIRAKPRLPAVETALRLHFSDWERRLELLKAVGPPIQVALPNGLSIYCEAVGLEPPEARRLVQEMAVFGKVPEPLRIARTLAEALLL